MGWGAEAVRKLDRLCDFEASVGWLFPALKGDGKGHQEINGFNEVLTAFQGVNWSPHGVRYGFTDYGERDLGFSRATLGIQDYSRPYRRRGGLTTSPAGSIDRIQRSPAKGNDAAFDQLVGQVGEHRDRR